MPQRHLLAVIAAAFFTICSVTVYADDHAVLAQRFRPYCKFSLEKGAAPEHTRPCTWQWFVSHSVLVQDLRIVAVPGQLQQNPNLIIKQYLSDVRGLRATELTKPYKLVPLNSSHDGQPWRDVMEDGAGLYAQVEEAGNNQVVIVYWILYAYNLGTQGSFFNHDGDLTAVSLVYDRPTDQLVRASFVLHGEVLDSFDLTGAESVRREILRGINVSGAGEAVEAEARRISPGRSYQDGPWWHSPSLPADVFLVQDESTGKFEHLALFIEWGAHEIWPNPAGSVTAAPKHTGDGISFLPKTVHFVGSINAPTQSETPFLFFNGLWGDPPSAVFHRICFDPKGVRRPTLGIPDNVMTDRDPYWNNPMRWPPAVFSTSNSVRIVVSCAGNSAGAQTTVRWGHPDFHDHEYFPALTINRGQTLERSFNIPDAESEFEVQTEGGEGTSYSISAWVNTGSGIPETPSLTIKHNVGMVRDEAMVLNNVSAIRSGQLNKYGEQCIRVSTRRAVTGSIR